MILEGLRMLADALEHSTDGVNAQLADLPLDAGDVKPPDIKDVLDTTQDDQAARGGSGMNWPVFVLDQEAPATTVKQTSGAYADADRLMISMRYVTLDPDSAEAVRDTLYTLRAARRAVGALFTNERATDRTRNKVQLHSNPEITYGLVREDLSEGAVTGALVVVCQARDLLK